MADAAWSSLAAEAQHSKQGDLVVRRAQTQPSVYAFRSVVGASLRRQLMVEVSGPNSVDVDELPRWRGVAVGISQLAPLGERGWYVVLSQQLGGTEDVFEFVADDICARIADAAGPNDVVVELQHALKRWSGFFSQHGFEGLGPARIRGLYGELLFLRDHVIPRFGQVLAMNAWHGQSRANHDFQVGPHAFEVKTTTARGPFEVRVSSERQLDDVGLDSLHLVVVVVAELPDGPHTLPALVNDLREKLSSDVEALDGFNGKLIEGGYLDAHAPRYSSAYEQRSLRWFRVREGFPRITESMLPDGIGDATYTLSLAACKDFAVDEGKAFAPFPEASDDA